IVYVNPSTTRENMMQRICEVSQIISTSELQRVLNDFQRRL
ncbi:hypothetical protein EAI_05902, partial [Harpegnathos saltator]